MIAVPFSGRMLGSGRLGVVVWFMRLRWPACPVWGGTPARGSLGGRWGWGSSIIITRDIDPSVLQHVTHDMCGLCWL